MLEEAPQKLLRSKRHDSCLAGMGVVLPAETYGGVADGEQAVVRDGQSHLTGKQVLAVLLSSLMPGFGQFYNADHKKGAVMLAAYFLCVGLSATRIGLLAILPIVIWSTIDAYRVSIGSSHRW